VPPANVINGTVLKNTSGSCYTYIGNYVGYTPPSGFIWSYFEMFTATTANTYTSCLTCLTPEPTPAPSYLMWRSSIEFSLSCPVCELTNGGTPKTFYTEYNVSSLQTGVYIYEDNTLQIPVLASYMRYGGIVYSVDSNGRITELCNQNGNC
jgi:hypothetical protein